MRTESHFLGPIITQLAKFCSDFLPSLAAPLLTIHLPLAENTPPAMRKPPLPGLSNSLVSRNFGLLKLIARRAGW
ncbi:MAG: hypothetical protein SFV81_04060 [Pirellulaceae bacterium]|nr:hypothetical protein [Pirellulaceae bacterium]